MFAPAAILTPVVVATALPPTYMALPPRFWTNTRSRPAMDVQINVAVVSGIDTVLAAREMFGALVVLMRR